MIETYRCALCNMIMSRIPLFNKGMFYTCCNEKCENYNKYYPEKNIEKFINDSHIKKLIKKL